MEKLCGKKTSDQEVHLNLRAQTSHPEVMDYSQILGLVTMAQNTNV
jgi:hypothetical protein